MSETTTSPEGSAPPIVEAAPVAAQTVETPPDEMTMHLRWSNGASTLQQQWTKANGDSYWADIPVAD